MKGLYLGLALLGAALPLSQWLPFLWENGFRPAEVFELLFANPVSAFFGLDVIVSGLVVLVLVQHEGRRLGMRHRWVYVLGTLSVGVSFGLPLFLWVRESALEASA